MDYEEKYKEALERARNLHKDAIDMGENIRAKQCEIIFPEIKESEDEMIRKELITHCRNTRCVTEEGAERIAKWISWLEKQESVEEIVERCKTLGYNEGKIQGQIEGLTNDEKYQQGLHDAFENQGEQSINDNKLINPKFNIGDWVLTDKGDTVQIGAVNNGYYTIDNGMDFNASYVDRCWHKWTIKDAKSGDVLACNEEILLFKSYSVQGRISLYCWYNGKINNFHSKEVTDTLLTTRNKIYPATKEQRDLLFQKMKEAGYKWDAEKKKPKKIHVIDEDKAELDYCFTKMMNGEKVKPKEPEGALKHLLDEQEKLYKEAKIVLEDKDTALAFLRRTGIIDEYGALAEKYRSDQTPATTISAVNGAYSTAISDGNTSVTSKEVERHYCTGQYEPDVREFPVGWSEENEYNLLSAIKKLEKLAEYEKRVAERDNWERTYVLIDWIKSLKDKVQSLSQPKEWSEQDERMRQYVVNDLRVVKELVNDPNYAVSVEMIEKEIDWMESLKERYAWKPSDEQMRALHDMNLTGNISYAGQGQTLIELYNDLKKLREG